VIPIRAKETGGRRIGDTENKAYDVVAVSDAEQPGESHTFAFKITADERDEYLKKVVAFARKQVEQFRATRYPMPTKSAPTRRGATPRIPVFNWAFSDEKFVVFDLFTNNNPQLIYTARVEPEALAAKSPEVFATVVATLDVQGNLEKVFSSVTDISRLDVTPRLELVDAVDAEGNGRGDLLFRRTSASDSDFILYRLMGNSLEEVFHGGWAGD
jgi:hypothetical protein